jgi:hypothetical protein
MNESRMKQIDKWFANHKIKVLGETEFIYADPDSSNYFCHVIARPNAIVVFGDMDRDVILHIYDKDPGRILATVAHADINYLCGKLRLPWESKYDAEMTKEGLTEAGQDPDSCIHDKWAEIQADIGNDWDTMDTVYQALEDNGISDPSEYLCDSWNHAHFYVYALQLCVKAWFAEKDRLAAAVPPPQPRALDTPTSV